MLKAAIGTLAGAIFLFLGVLAWLVWPAPSVELNWEATAEEFIAEGDCYRAADIMGIYSFVDRKGFNDVRDEIFQQSVCAISEDSDIPADQLFLRGLFPSDPESLSLLEPIPWWEGVKTAAKRWDDVRWYRQHVGMGFAGWTDAVAFFRCERALGHYPAGHWLTSRDDLHSLFPDFVAPYDDRRARCISFVESELERISEFDIEPEYSEGEIYQQILNEYEFLLQALRGSMEFIES